MRVFFYIWEYINIQLFGLVFSFVYSPTSHSIPVWFRGHGGAFQTHLTQTKPVLPLSNEHGSQVKNQVRRQCCHNKHKKFPYRPTRAVFLLSGHVSHIYIYVYIYTHIYKYIYIYMHT